MPFTTPSYRPAGQSDTPQGTPRHDTAVQQITLKFQAIRRMRTISAPIILHYSLIWYNIRYFYFDIFLQGDRFRSPCNHLVRDSVSKVKLPTDLTVGDSRAGVGKGDLPRFQVIQKCAKIQETVLKIPSTASVSDPAINQLTIVAIAQIRYLQEEYTNLLVSNQFDDSTAQLFKTLQQNPAAFTAGAVENLQRAVTIAGARQVSHAASYGRVTECLGRSHPQLRAVICVCGGRGRGRG